MKKRYNIIDQGSQLHIIYKSNQRKQKMENVSYQELLQLAYERINEKLFEEELTNEQFAQLTLKEIEIWNKIQIERKCE